MSKSTSLPEIGLVREPVVLAHVGVGRTKWREMVKAGKAPAPRRISERVSVYDASAVRNWIAEQCAPANKVAA